MIDTRNAPRTAELAAVLRPGLRGGRAKDPAPGRPLETGIGCAGLHGGRDLHGPGLDRVDAGFPVRRPPHRLRGHRGSPGSSSTADPSTLRHMAGHLTHTGVHDHGFNNVSTYGTLLRLMHEGTIPEDPWERRYYALALKASGAVQAARWTPLPEGLGFIHSFNGPHSLFADTMRSLRSLALAHSLGPGRSWESRTAGRASWAGCSAHAETTARYNVYFGRGRDRWDLRGRVAHESVFNTVNGSYRCPSSQQGYSPYTTWTRGLAWIMLGFAEELEFAAGLSDAEVAACGLPYFPDAGSVRRRFLEVARAVCDFYLENTPPDGIPYWDTGGPRLHEIPGALDQSRRSAATRSSRWTPPRRPSPRRPCCAWAPSCRQPATPTGAATSAAGLRTAATVLMAAPYLSEDPNHEGLLLHAVYHYPNGWDRSADGSPIPHGESCMWGDYHLLELALWISRAGTRAPRRSDSSTSGPIRTGGTA